MMVLLSMPPTPQGAGTQKDVEEKTDPLTHRVQIFS